MHSEPVAQKGHKRGKKENKGVQGPVEAAGRRTSHHEAPAEGLSPRRSMFHHVGIANGTAFFLAEKRDD